MWQVSRFWHNTQLHCCGFLRHLYNERQIKEEGEKEEFSFSFFKIKWLTVTIIEKAYITCMFNKQEVICLGLGHVFFSDLVQILFLDISLPTCQKFQNLGQRAIASRWNGFLLQWVQCSRVFQSMWVMQCMFPPSYPEFSRQNFESHWVWWIVF